jgi:hypothetical protein
MFREQNGMCFEIKLLEAHCFRRYEGRAWFHFLWKGQFAAFTESSINNSACYAVVLFISPPEKSVEFENKTTESEDP